MFIFALYETDQRRIQGEAGFDVGPSDKGRISLFSRGLSVITDAKVRQKVTFFKKYLEVWRKTTIFAEIYGWIMIKKLLTLSLVLGLALVPVCVAGAGYANHGIEEIEEPAITVSISQSVLTITGAQGMTAEIVSLTGKPVATIRIDSPVQRIDLNLSKGCYIVRIGKVVRKIAIK